MKDITVNIHDDINEAVNDAWLVGIATRLGDGCITLRGEVNAVNALLAHWGYGEDGEVDHGPAPLTSVCGWCPDAKLETAAAIANGKNVTHGICPSCAAKFNAGQR